MKTNKRALNYQQNTEIRQQGDEMNEVEIANEVIKIGIFKDNLKLRMMK
ncbi:hypothetical protein [Helicobacter apodemus]|nr:hypothetical protein [Helicobacter apodemus]